MKMAKQPGDLIPALTIDELKAALRHGARLFAMGRGLGEQPASEALIEQQAVAVRAAARRFAAGMAAQRPPAPRVIGDPSNSKAGPREIER